MNEIRKTPYGSNVKRKLIFREELSQRQQKVCTVIQARTFLAQPSPRTKDNCFYS